MMRVRVEVSFPLTLSETPNTVIKHPMDLGTMAKKVKTHVYKTQREFVDDLNLIWNNCLMYNTDPVSGRVDVIELA